MRIAGVIFSPFVRIAGAILFAARWATPVLAEEVCEKLANKLSDYQQASQGQKSAGFC